MKYKQYLNSNYWKFIKLFNKLSKKRKCRICKSNRNIHIHHKRYSRNGKSILFREKSCDLMFLCGYCHFMIHRSGIDLRNISLRKARIEIKQFRKKENTINRELDYVLRIN